MAPKRRNWFFAGLSILFIGLLLARWGKSSKKEDSVAPSPRVTLKSIEFPRGSPQLNAVRTTEALPFKQGEATFTGQLVWNEDYTNRFFSPVAGRVQAVIAQVGQMVNTGDDLALMRSP